MTPRERAQIGCKSLTVASPGSLLEEDILTNMIESAESEARFAEREECAFLVETQMKIEEAALRLHRAELARTLAAAIRGRNP